MTKAEATHLYLIAHTERTGNLSDRVLASLLRKGFILPFARKSQIPVTIDGMKALNAYIQMHGLTL